MRHRLLSVLSRASIPFDVDPATGSCADGAVRIASAAGKGFGAFAARALTPSLELGRYRGELLTLAEYRLRYGETEEGAVALPRHPADEEEHRRWSSERWCRGVGTTGQYVFRLSGEPAMFLDAEDPAHANWTRFINHSSEPNLAAIRGQSDVRFVVQRPIAPGAELTFSYGAGYARWIERYCRPPASARRVEPRQRSAPTVESHCD